MRVGSSGAWAFLLGMLAVGSSGSIAAAPAPDPFSSIVDGVPPRVLRTLGRETIAGKGVSVERLVIEVAAGKTAAGERINEVYCLRVTPDKAGVYPGMLLLHGGRGIADELLNQAIDWASRGYVVFAPELPGVADPGKAVHSNGEWKSVPYGEGRWTTRPDITASSIFQGVVTALRSLYLLRSDPRVDRSRVGVHGVSWGGYMTTMVCALAGKDVTAGFSMFGTGHFEQTTFGASLSKMAPAERERWYEVLDAGRRAGQITAPFFVAAPCNDHYFWPPAVEATLADIPGETGHVYAPNAHHKMPVPGGNAGLSAGVLISPLAQAFFDYWLKNQGAPLPKVVVQETSKVSRAEARVRFTVTGSWSPLDCCVYYSVSSPTWTEREWKKLAVTPEPDGSYTAGLPLQEGKDLDWFVLVSADERVSVSSKMMRWTQKNHEER